MIESDFLVCVLADVLVEEGVTYVHWLRGSSREATYTR